MNNFSGIGTVVTDPKLQESSNGIKSSSFTLAIKKEYASAGNKDDFIMCRAFKRTAEIIDERIKKGDQVGIYGSLNSFKNKDGIFSYNINVSKIYFIKYNKNKQETEELDDFEDVEDKEIDFNFDETF